LARFGDSYVVAVDENLLTTNWARQFEVRRVGDRPIRPPTETYLYPQIEKNEIVNSIVDRLDKEDYGGFVEAIVYGSPKWFSLSPMVEPFD
jgi:hypothetical protein